MASPMVLAIRIMLLWAAFVVFLILGTWSVVVYLIPEIIKNFSGVPVHLGW